MNAIEAIAKQIDAAIDCGDELLLDQLTAKCQQHLETAESKERIYLFYFQANIHAALAVLRNQSAAQTNAWEQPDEIQNILLLRRAVKEPALDTVDPIYQCSIRTNLATRLFSLGRPIASNEQSLSVMEIEPRFAKALATRANATCHYARTLYDDGHKPIMLANALSLFDAALNANAVWESEDYNKYVAPWTSTRNEIAEFLSDIAYDETYDLNQWSLGKIPKERHYRKWCLNNRLFLNPLNDMCTDSVAATDVLHLPSHSHIYANSGTPRFPAYFNLLKQEYISARYRLYYVIHEDDPEFLMRDVSMLDSGENQVLGHCFEDLRSAFRSAYAIFDKISLFLADYYLLDIDLRHLTFRNVWLNKQGDLRSVFNGRQNWLLRGLYFLSKDLHDASFTEVAEPDAVDLARLRNQVEHRFVNFEHVPRGINTEAQLFMLVDDFVARSLRLLKLAREALIYLSLAMHWEEQSQQEETEEVDEDSRFQASRVEPRQNLWD